MEEQENQNKPSDARPHYRWPWFVLAAVILWILLAVVWMSKEVERTRRMRDYNAPLPGSK